MKKILLTAILILTAGIYCNAENKTFIREYHYQAGESDSNPAPRP